MGLLDLFTPETIGLLAAGGPQTDLSQTGYGQRLAAASGFEQQWKKRQSDAEMEKQKMAMNAMMMQENQLKMDASRQSFADQMAMRGAAQQSFISPDRANSMSMGPSMNGGAVDPVQSGFDQKGYLNKLYGINPMEAMKYEQSIQKETPINKLDVKDFTPASVQKFALTKNYGDLVRMDKLHFADTGSAITGLDQFTGQKVAATDKTGDKFKDLILQNQQGDFVPNAPLVAAKLSLAKAAAPNVNTTVSVAGPENEYNKTIGKGLADAGLATVDIAKGAADTVRNAQMIKQALAGGAITGTGANTRLAVQKALETAGLIGEGKAADTQALMAGLNKLTLSAVKTSGLGAGNGFTDKDREFLAASASGTIESTPTNLIRAANLSEKAARASHAKGAEVLKRWSGDKALAPVAQDTVLDTPAPEGAKTVVKTGVYGGRKVVKYSDGSTAYAD
jgi:hypothetical protein